METSRGLSNRVKQLRTACGWSQAELAERAAISRAAVSAIEGQRLIPSVAAALALARALECAVEELFGAPAPPAEAGGWAWPPPTLGWPAWEAEVGGRLLWYPIEFTSGSSNLPHDLRADVPRPRQPKSTLAGKTLVVACCDPAIGLLSTLYARLTGYRLIAIPRSSQSSLKLLSEGLVHVAGLHLTCEGDDRNATAVQERLGSGYKLLQVATWQEGLAVSRGQRVTSIRSAMKSRLRWVGREQGSGARKCLDEMLPRRTVIRRIAHDHRGVADAIRSGWADAGVCLRLTSDEFGLNFLSLRQEQFEFCFAAHAEGDPRIAALIRVVRTTEYRRLLADLPGYDPTQSGALRCVP